MIYTVTLNPSLDYYLQINELKADVQQAERTFVDYGGKGINVSVVLKRLGIDSVALGMIGGFSGSKLLSLLSNEKINTDFVNIQADTRINIKMIGATNMVINACGPAITLSNEQELMTKLQVVSDGDYLVLSGSIPASMGSSAYERIVSSVFRDVKLVVDTTGPALQSLLAYHPFLVKPNHHELGELLHTSIESTEDAVSGARQLQRMGAANVLVSMGKGGMLLVDENGDVNYEPIIDGKVRNTNGCGDSTVAGFLAGYIERGNYRYALRLASVCGNATAFCDRLASAKDISALMSAME